MEKYSKLHRPTHRESRRNCTPWLYCLLLTIAIAATASARAEDKGKTDFDAEDKQAAKEDEDQNAERIASGTRSTRQRLFNGKYVALADLPQDGSQEELSPDVVGVFFTNKSDRKPERKYLVKVENGDKKVLDL